jgi:7,8-dihydropterin-6-yl-methyl-4-(beta-D-ribofuranosyl)aminobenzene 5'-phosphate synthase
MTVIYDNNAYAPELQTAWGFACLVETEETAVLFDTGGDSPTLLANMDALDIDPASIGAVVLSHIHQDHTGGLSGLLDMGIQPTVVVPAAFPADFKRAVRARTDLIEVDGPMEILPGFHSTGQMGAEIVEQALIVETPEGPVVLCGCAHPGVVNMARRAQETIGGELALVMGGFHLGRATQEQVASIIGELQALGVQRFAPSHCTGDEARQIFSDSLDEMYIQVGAGAVIHMGE